MVFLCLLGVSTQAGSILREVFEGIAGTAISDLTNATIYPDHPTLTNFVTDFFEAPVDWGDNYGQRMHGFIVPPVTGNYTFWIATDDNGELWLSTDDVPAHSRIIATVNSWTSSREWTKEPNQQSAPVRLEAGKAYYIAALQKEGGGGDNLAVRWLRPDGVDEGPIPATYLLPYGTSFTPPIITQQPTNTTVVEGQLATFVIKVQNLDLISYRWWRNGAEIPGATGSILNYGPVTLADGGARFSVTLTNRLGATNSTEASLTVLPDTTRPTLVSALNLGPNTIRLIYSEPVATPGVTNAVNYALNQGASVSSVASGADTRTVLLSTTTLSYGTAYTFRVNNVTDLAATPNAILPDSSITFTAVEYAPQDIGSPALAGSSLAVPGGFDVTGGGKEIGGMTDQFHFSYQERKGNFDVQVRVAGATISDPYLHAGLMARETLDANSRFGAIFASSPQLGCFFESRNAVSATAVTAAPPGGYPVNYPQTWLRLRRSGTTLTGFASLDSQTWVQLGSVSISGLAPTLIFGFAVASEDPSMASAVQFRDVGPTVSMAVGAYTPAHEPLGPSSRTTSLVISEIMYHPKARPDVKHLEFIEIYNARAVFEDLTGWRISGDIDFRFPDGFELQAGEFVVIAAAPNDLKAVYGITNVLGPYTNSLPNDTGTIRLRNQADAIRLEVNYSGNPPWPAAADGAGHSLVLAQPSYGENDPRAWAASELVGGSPGGLDAVFPNPQRNVVINEFLAHTDPPQLDFIELYNRSNTDVDLSGCWLSDDPATNKFRIPANTIIPGRGFRAWDENELGFRLDAGGETIYLVNSNATRVLDAVRFAGQENGVASGRSPDGALTIRRLANPTPGAANAPWRIEDLVINEIMYHPISGESDDEYVELYNRSAAAMDLSGWKFTAGINFKFPTNTTIGAGACFVVARNAARLLANYPQLNPNNTFGDFQGSLGNSGDHLAFGKPEDLVHTNQVGELATNHTHVVIAEVRYWAGGRWGQWADGGGSSLELIDPHADPLQPSNWADSDETQKAEWTAAEFTGKLDNGNTDAAYPPNRLHILMQGAGECLVDDVEVIKSGGTNLVSNGGFENGSAGWSFFGNHSQSRVETTGAASGSGCLHVRAQGDGDTGVNSIRAALVSGLASGNTATIRAKVRWLAGWPEVLFRTRGNWIDLSAQMATPRNLGTPGLPNSRRVPNAGPAIYEVRHQPALPRANEPVVVTCRVSDPDGIGALNLRYRVDPSATLSTVPMRDDGTGGDAIAGDGVYSATISGRTANTLIAFRIEATDSAASAVTTLFPATAPALECLVRWGDPVPFGTFAHYHLWSTQATESARGASTALNNTYRDATLVYGNFRVIYNVGFRDKGSPYHGGSGDFAVTVPPDDLLLGTPDRVFASTGNGGSEETGIRSQLSAFWFAQQLGIPYLHANYMQLYRNGGQFREVMEDLEQPGREYAGKWFPEGGDGDLYKVAVWFEFQDDNSSFSAISATLERFLTTGNTYKLARYRWNWLRRPNDGTANNYTNLFDLVAAANDTSANYVNRLLNLADVEQWMRIFAYHRAMGNWDSWSYSVGQNMFVYKMPGQRWILFPWDIDFTFGLGDGPSGSLWDGQDPVVNRMYATPALRRMLWRTFIDAVNGPMLPERYTPQIEARRAILLKNGVAGLADPHGIYTYLTQRRTYLQTQIKANDVATFAITTNNGNDYNSATPTATLAGTAPFVVATLEVNGIPYPVKWADQTHFQISVPLTQATNSLALVGKDRLGQPVPGGSDSITVTYSGAIQQPQDYVVLNEIQYNPAVAQASFIELFNGSTTVPFDLSNFRLDGVGYTFAEGAILQPNSYLLLAKDRAAFATAYGATIPVFDEFPGTLDNGGEHLALVKPGPTPAEDVAISDVRFDNRLPWPTNADGFGPSLQLVDPAQDEYRAGNWTATATNDVNRATPGRANSVRQSLEPFPLIWLNEVLPNNVSSITDNAGEHDPWIELYNSGDAAIDLSPFYLTDSYTDLTQWQFPVGTSIGPHQFLLVWADGQPGQSLTGAPHTTFRLNPTNGSLALVRLQGSPSAPGAMDYLDYVAASPDRSFGSYPDGEPRKRRVFYYATPDATNNPVFPQIEVVLNEFMAGNTNTLVDPANGRFEDWFELYNAGTNAVDLTAYSLTDNLTNANQFVIPPGYVIPPGGYLLVWADEQTGHNGPTNRDLHVNFKLALTGEQLGLFAPDGRLVDGFTFGPQSDDVSMGRFPDGADGPLVFLDTPTPRAPNVLAGGNRPPVLNPIGSKSVAEQTLLEFTATASDPDAGQTLSFNLGADAPDGASIDAVTGQFTWTPTEAQGPGTYSLAVRVSDNGTPPRSATEHITVTVTEVNRPPKLAPVADQNIDEGALFTLPVAATDPDLPSNTLTFSLDPNAPAGGAIDPVTGVFTWTPSEDQGPGQYSITVRVTDNGSPPLSDTNTFKVTVNEVNNPPVLDNIFPQTVDELSTFTLTVHAVDPDTPPSPIVYSLDIAPAGVWIDQTTGVITWTPTEAQGPANAIFVVRATETVPPNLSATATFSVAVNEKNQRPVLAPISDYRILEGETLTFTAAASDFDLPAQSLTFSLDPGAPAGAAIDPAAGQFTWTTDSDHGASTNQITVRVTDDGPGNLSDAKPFAVVVRPRWHVKINEIMYRPAATNAQYVELFNSSSNATHDLSGLVLEGANFSYAFPSSMSLAPRSFLCVAGSVAAFQTAYGSGLPVVGPWSGSLGSADTIDLFRPEREGQPYQLLDTVTFDHTAPWPMAANSGGASLQLIDATRDNNRVGNWAAVTNGSPSVPQWRFVSTNGTFGTSNPYLYLYLNAAGDIYVDDIVVVVGSTPGVGPNLIQNGDFESALTPAWNTTANTAKSAISTSVQHSGGSGLHLVCNAAGTTQGDSLWQTVASLTNGTQYTLSYWYLPNTNGGTLTVRFSGRWINTDENVLFDPGVPRATCTPGAPNNVAGALPEFPTLRINEVLPANTSGITDRAGEHEPWLELVNTGLQTVSLDGLFLTDDYSNLTKWPFPAGLTMPAGGFLVIFADGEPAEQTATELHTGFRIASVAGSLALARTQLSQPAVVDYLDYRVASADRSYGSAPDGEPAGHQILGVPTPGAPNQAAPPEIVLGDVTWTPQGYPQLAWETQPGQRFRVEFKNSLGDATWQSLGEITATSNTASMIDSAIGATNERYYRVQLLP